MTAPSPIRVMIVDDHPAIHVGVAAMLADFDDITVVAAVDRAAEAIERCGELEVHVALMDLTMPEMDGATGTTRLLERCPDVRVIVLTGGPGDHSLVRAAIDAGASGCLLKTIRRTELAEAIRGVTQGQSTFSTEFLPHLVGERQEKPSGTRLTPREHDILTLLADGSTNKEIARALDLTNGTVRVYVSTILSKLGAANRTEATVEAMRQGLISRPT
jgi:two-component system, NarL family, nitrate/nitrite response regulator NarL